MSESTPGSDAEFVRARRAVERGWVTKEQVEAAIAAGAPILEKLPLTPDQMRELEGSDGATILSGGATASARSTLPPEVAEALKDPKRRVGRFVLVSLLGKGGMGMVFRGWEPELRQWVALKFLRQIGNDTARAYFKREAQLAAGLDHPHIAKIYEIGEHEGQPFIAMQFVDGAPLSGKDLKLEEKIRIVTAIAEAVKYAHERKVIHRDLKPANVMIDKHGQVYVMDFGLAKETAVEGESLGGSSMVVGTPSYMAPEQAKGKAIAQSDVYGVGAILYELVTGRPPFTGESSTDVIMQVVSQEPVWPRKLSPDTPEDVEAIILHALEKDLGRRYATAEELIGDLEAFAQKNPLKSARRPTLSYVLGKKIRKQPLLWTFATLMVAAIFGGTGFGIYWLSRARSVALEKARVEREDREKADILRQAEADQRARAERGEREALDRADALIVEQAAAAIERDPTRALAALKSLSPTTRKLEAARLIAFQARTLATATLLVGHTAIIRSLAWSPDSRVLASGGEDNSVRLWDVDNATQRILTGHSGYVVHVAWSPDGRSLATAGWDRTVRVWDVASGEGRALAGYKNYVNKVAWSPDGQSIASVSWDGTVRVCDRELTNNRLVQQHDGKLVDVAWSPDGRWVASSCNDGTVGICDMRTGATRILRGHQKVAYCLAWSPDGHSLASGSWDETIRIWDIESGNSRIFKGHSGNVLHLAWSPDGRWLASASADRSVRGWEVESGNSGPVIEHQKAVWHVAWSPDGRKIVSAGDDGLVKMWELGMGLGHTVSGHDGGVLDVAWSPDGKRVASGGNDKVVRVWNADAGIRQRLPEEESHIGCIAWSPEGRRLGVGMDTAMVAWDLSPQKRHFTQVSPNSGWWFDTLSWSPDGRFLAGSRGEKSLTELHLWEVTADKIKTLEGHRDKILSIAWSRDGRMLASGGYDHDVRVWDPATGSSRALAGHRGMVTCVAWSPNGRNLASCSVESDPSIRVWDVSLNSVREEAVISESAGSIAWSSEGERLAWADSKKGIVLWNIRTGERRALTGPLEGLSDVSWSRDGKSIAAACDKTVRVWTINSGECRILGGHEDAVHGLDWSPDGSMLATRCGDANVWVWDVALGQKCALVGHPWGVKQIAWAPDGRALASIDFMGKAVRVWRIDVPSEPSAFFEWLGRVTNAIIGEDRALTAPAFRNLVTGPRDGDADLKRNAESENGVSKKLNAQILETRSRLRVVSTALSSYEMDVGRLPTTEEGLGALLSCPSGLKKADSWRGPYVAGEAIAKDAWGHPFVYRNPGRVKTTSYDLLSTGPDGIEGNQDDIWEKP